ncbi:hypothetical protein AB4144_30780, partial [Rhizobiaceae sp. 2RAB30]
MRLRLRHHALEQFQQKCAAVLRPELRENKELERFRDSEKSGNALGTSTCLLLKAMRMKINGSCCCGSVRFFIDGKPTVMGTWRCGG